MGGSLQKPYNVSRNVGILLWATFKLIWKFGPQISVIKRGASRSLVPQEEGSGFLGPVNHGSRLINISIQMMLYYKELARRQPIRAKYLMGVSQSEKNTG